MRGLLKATLILLVYNIPYISFGQVYKPIIKSDTSYWFFAHKQMAGNNIDTIFAGQKNDNTMEIWYKGAFYYREKTFAGNVRSNSNFDKLWYIPPDDTTIAWNLYNYLIKSNNLKTYKLIKQQ